MPPKRKQKVSDAGSASADSRRSSLRSNRRHKPFPSSIPNTADDEDNLSIGHLQRTRKRSISRRILEAVVIPKMEDTAAKSTRLNASDSTSSLTSAGSSVYGDNMVHQTPDTSVVNTPLAELSLRKKAVTSKRKRSSTESADTSRDESLARLLRDEEDAGPSSRNQTKYKEEISDSEAFSSYASDVDLSDASSDYNTSESDRPSKKRSRTAKGKGNTQPATTSSHRRTAASSDQTPQTLPGTPASELESDFVAEESEVIELSDDDISVSEGSMTTNTQARRRSRSGQDSLNRIRNASRSQAASRRQRVLARATVVQRRIQNWRDHRKAARRAKLEDAHPEIKTLWSDLAKVPVITPQPAAQPDSIKRKLKPFQLEGLDWMIRQEKSQYKGGLLGDEMGMGKTIQAVSLIMSDHPAKDPTLVLVPPIGLIQWSNEIREYTDGKLKVLICHQTNKEAKDLTVKKIRNYDVIVMSYNSLESMYRKQEKGWTRGDEIIKEKSPIHAVHFHRLILDEAHSIKQRTTGSAKACFALEGTYKWCLSGTPVQNRIGEFFSLLRFLEVRPFADYFCQRCPCARLDWAITDDYKCMHCNHASSEHRSVFNEELLNPITSEDTTARHDALKNLHMITARVMLRRMKKDHTESMELPPKEVVVHNEFFAEIESDFARSIMANTTRKFDTYVAQGVMLNNYANIFTLITQMRQVANHPDLLLKRHAEGAQNVLVCNICDEPAEEAIRSKCHHEFCRSCARSYVESCEGAGGVADCPRCHIPMSIDWEQPDIEQDDEQVAKSSIINRIKMDNWTSSTKIEMLVYELYKLRSNKQTIKSIVFSNFTSFLQLIEWRLRRAGFNTSMLDGSMSPVQRQKSIDYFMNNADVEVFLVSLKAGGVALNLTEASRVFIVDPWWNPAAEWQSADRSHRIGQTRPCVVTRLVIEDSVESRMIQLQQKKANMISSTINNDAGAMERLSPEDLQFLFRGT